MAQVTLFVEEINYNEIEILEVVGKGSFGVVNKGKWRDKFVAVKMISSESEKKAFIVEVRQLSRVNHPNIVRLYGACTNKPVCLVMEYAEGGSLYNVLHGNPQPEYTASHAISWALQCANGVAYLHNMKPKALIHRDLKPPNLLLIMAGTVLKICDFGTACDMHTHMTNNKGSAAWMAPEVFEGSIYSEKCDVFSWGIILWEVITRRKPFDDSGSAYRILWAVHSGKRPPLIKNCPKPLEILMTRCWAEKPSCRPSMDEVVSIMSHMFSFFKGADEPIKYPPPSEMQLDTQDSDDSDDYSDEGLCESELSGPPMASSLVGSDESDQSHRFATDLKESCETLSELNIITGPSSFSSALQSRMSMTSAPASLAGSKEDVRGELENTLDGGEKPSEKCIGTKSVRPGAHQRSGSFGSNFVIQPPGQLLSSKQSVEAANNDGIAKHIGIVTRPSTAHDKSICGNRIPPGERKQSWPQQKVPRFLVQQQTVQPSPETIENAYRLLDSRLQPLTPNNRSWESMEIFEEHKKMACEYLRVQTELALLLQRKVELMSLLKENAVNACDVQQNGGLIMNEYDKLTKEKENLKQLHQNLKQQLAITRNQQDQH